MQRQTTMAKKADITKKCYLVDASTVPLGRLASEAAKILMGKNKPTYTPNVDTGDYVIIINAGKAVLTGDKINTKLYHTQVSQQPGGLRTRTAKVMKDKYPIEMVEHAVRGMLPKGSLGQQMFKKLFVSVDGTYPNPHANQVPEALDLKGR